MADVTGARGIRGVCAACRPATGAMGVASRLDVLRWGFRCGKETPLASLLEGLLPGLDAWIAMADAYLEALDALRPAPSKDRPRNPRQAWAASEEARRSHYIIEQRTRDLATWHGLLLHWLGGTEAEDRLDRLVRHTAIGGPELAFVEARLRHRRGDAAGAHQLMYRCLEKLPGHRDFLEFARQIGAPLPPRAREA